MESGRVRAGRFRDRTDAGRVLATRLEHLRDPNTVVLALPRGGVPVGVEVSRHLGAPLDVIVVRKLGVPSQPELAMGAIGENGVQIVDERMVALAGVRRDELEAVERVERAELDRRILLYRGTRTGIGIRNKTALIIDDGIATGSTARAAAMVARLAGAARVVIAAPVGPADSIERLASVADEVVLARTPDPFHAIGAFYTDFAQTSDAEVKRLLETEEE
ncbi:MAG: phosphoribosyltransferase family protein [Acidimicrobiia bacterium]